MIPDPFVQPWANVRVGDFLICSAEGVPEIEYHWEGPEGWIYQKDLVVCGLFLTINELVYGSKGLKNGNSRHSQEFARPCRVRPF